MKLEELQTNASVRGIIPDGLVAVVSVQWFGSEALELTYKTPDGKVANELLYLHDEPRLEIVEVGRPWSFDGDGALFRLVSEAYRIRLAHLFDPVLAVHTSLVDPLPHQITAVYEAMLPRQPLRFLLADDPGAGKTIIAGLLMKELIARGDLPTLPSGVSGEPRRTMAGRTLSSLSSTLRDPNQRQARSRAYRKLVSRNEFSDCPARQAIAQRRCPAEAPGTGMPLGSHRLRRSAQDVRHGVRW